MQFFVFFSLTARSTGSCFRLFSIFRSSRQAKFHWTRRLERDMHSWAQLNENSASANRLTLTQTQNLAQRKFFLKGNHIFS